jgi:hypothetical protein
MGDWLMVHRVPPVVEWRAGAQHAMPDKTGDACSDNGRPGHLEVTDNVVAPLL